MNLDPRINRLQDVTARLRSGRPITRHTVHRRDGVISHADEEHFPFDAPALLREGEQLNLDLNAAGLVGDEGIVYAAALVDFIESAEAHAAPGSLPGLRRTRDELRDRLDAAGVRL